MNVSYTSYIYIYVQIPISVGVSSYKATALFTRKREIASTSDQGKEFTVIKLIIYCVFGLLSGVIGGLLGLGGGFIISPLFLELGIPPQVSFELHYYTKTLFMFS